MKRVELTHEVINERMKKFGKAISVWICDANCQHQISSFLYNWEQHVPEECPNCKNGKMMEDKSKREVQANFFFIDKSREKNWEKGLTPMQQASVLMDEMSPY